MDMNYSLSKQTEERELTETISGQEAVPKCPLYKHEDLRGVPSVLVKKPPVVVHNL